jgi:fucose permease
MKPTPRTTLAICFSSTFVVGMLSGALGPLLPHLAGRLGVPVEAVGSLFTALFLGAVLTQFTGGWLAERFGLHSLAVTGAALLTLGILGLSVSPDLPLILFCAFLAGSGQGLLDIGTNVLIAAVFEERRVVSAVNLLHFAFGAGAVLSPLLSSLAISAWRTPMPVLWLAAALGAVTLLAATRWLMKAHGGGDEEARRAGGAFYGSARLWLMGLLLFLYVGSEMGVGGWTTVYAGRTTALAPGAIALLLSCYWLSLTAGRLVGAALGTRMRSRVLALWAVTGASLGALVVLAGSGSAAWTAAGTVVMGLSFGPIFPTVVVMGTETFRVAPGRAVSIIISVSSLGGMFLPMLQGVLLERVSPLASVAQVAVACLGMMAVLLLATRRPRAQPSQASEA